MANKAQLVRHILAELTLLQAGQVPNPDEEAAVEPFIRPALDDLAMRGVIYVPDEDDFDDGLLHWLAMYIAQCVARYFGAEPDGEMMRAAEVRLRALNSTREYLYQPARPAYF